MSLAFGLACICLTYLVEAFGDGILPAALSIQGMLGGPTLAVFWAGVLFPFVNHWGVHFGWVVGCALGVWTYAGSRVYPPGPEHSKMLERSTYRYITYIDLNNHSEMIHCSCNATQVVQPVLSTTLVNATEIEKSPLVELYSISYMYLGTLAYVGCMISAMIISLVTPKQKKIHSATIVSVFGKLPIKVQRFLSRGLIPRDEPGKVELGPANGNSNVSYVE